MITKKIRDQSISPDAHFEYEGWVHEHPILEHQEVADHRAQQPRCSLQQQQQSSFLVPSKLG
jgi:hypothetical protein